MKRENRGQTTLDFSIGISILLLVLVFVFLFVPNLFSPFNSGTQEETVAVDRVADELSQRMLGSIEEPYILNTTCTIRFFDGRAPGSCDFAGSSMRDQLDLENRNRVNVTITKAKAISISDGSNIRCWDESAKKLTTKDSCTPPDDVSFQTGEPVPEGTSSSISARRVVLLHGIPVSIKVVMW